MKKPGRGASAPASGPSTGQSRGAPPDQAKRPDRGAGTGGGASEPAGSKGPKHEQAGGGQAALSHPHKGKTGLRRKRRRRGKNGAVETVASPASPPQLPEPAAAASEPLARKARRRRRRRGGRGAGIAAAPTLAGKGVAGAAPAAVTADSEPPTAQRPEPADSEPVRPAIVVQQRLIYAALDLGTNNCRLLLASPGRPGQFRVVDAFSRIVRLGEGLGATGRLKQEAMDRAVDALAICRDKLKSRPVRLHRLIATEACRSAANGADFLARVAEETGLQLEVIDRETEARLAVSGCGSLVERDTRAVVLFDIGGGSSEIALIDLSGRRSGRLSDHIVAWTSLPVGVVTLAEAFGGHHVTPESFEAMVSHVANLLDAFENRHKLGPLASGNAFHLLGTSGTVTTIAGIHLGLERYDRRRVDGLWMRRADVDAMLDRLTSWTFEERRANPCIGADRADLVLAGCAIFEAIRRVWPAERLRVADRGLREGLLMEMMSADGAWRRAAQGGLS